ncbi:hypothetical protein [Saccharothrix violaceirubra]|uniref:Uncharacterized protein n=1 Tax=Saccharothrix violaceirubra TaxID=413306 RepID=A0A7W7T4M1_9PSEU|nr:hypothetical protein [Saccharothrix violaceirubra]MBB4966441.1 hypothetical protein [Saccharothrix violaceirubra]
MTDVHRFEVFADFSQFMIADLRPHHAWLDTDEGDDDEPAGWTEEAVLVHRLGVQPHQLAIATDRPEVAETVEVVLHVGRTPPGDLLPEAGHVVEADLSLPTGVLSVFGPSDDEHAMRLVPLAPGRYRARVSHLPARVYRVDLWPATEAVGVVVLVQSRPDLFTD